jgi:hypothetical protein
MPALLKENMEAVNRYFMEGKVRTAAAEKVKQEWMAFWKDVKRDWTWYTQEEYDKARNLRKKYDLANAPTAQAKQVVTDHYRNAQGTTEQSRGETRRSGTEGDYLVESDPIIPTAWKVGAVVAVGLVAVGAFGKQLLKLTPYGRLARFLP